MHHSPYYLFGGPHKWSPDDWTSSDDRVRGGASHSALVCSDVAKFTGNLDITTLGGAGFASQRTTGERHWDLSTYDGLELDVGQSDDKLYTLTLKDCIPPQRPDGRDESGVSWEFDFRVAHSGTIVMKWEDLRATYRGKEVKDPKPLDRSNIKRVSVMIRSFFGDQEGDFGLELRSIAAVRLDGLKSGAVVHASEEEDSELPVKPSRAGCCIIQ